MRKHESAGDVEPERWGNMKITISFCGPIRRTFAEQEKTIEMDDGQTIAALLTALSFSKEEQLAIVILQNGKSVRPYQRLRDGDRVEIAVLIGGG